jgi:hypothetical protein
MDISWEYGNKFSGSINDDKFLDKLNDCQVLKKDSVPSTGLVVIRDI